MSLPSLNSSLPGLREVFPTPRSTDRPRRQGSSGQPGAGPLDAFLEEPPPTEPEPFAAIIKADLTGLTDREPRPTALHGEAASSADAFLRAFSRLLSAVGSGDAGGAREAATALQLELFGAPSALAATEESGDVAQARMLNDLVSLIRFARLGELGSADASAHLLARDLQAALLAPAAPAPMPVERLSGSGGMARTSLPEPASLVYGATAAYEMLMDLDADANAA